MGRVSTMEGGEVGRAAVPEGVAAGRTPPPEGGGGARFCRLVSVFLLVSSNSSCAAAAFAHAASATSSAAAAAAAAAKVLAFRSLAGLSWLTAAAASAAAHAANAKSAFAFAFFDQVSHLFSAFFSAAVIRLPSPSTCQAFFAPAGRPRPLLAGTGSWWAAGRPHTHCTWLQVHMLEFIWVPESVSGYVHMLVTIVTGDRGRSIRGRGAVGNLL